MAQLAREHDLLAVCDETYEYFTYDSNQHLTLAALDGMAERTLTSYTFTKAYAMSGWRLGCMVAPAALLEPLLKIQEQTASFVSPFVQMAGLAALRGPARPPGPLAGRLQRTAHPGRRPAISGPGGALPLAGRGRPSFFLDIPASGPRKN